MNLNFHQDLFGDFYALMMVAADAFMLMPLTTFQRPPWNPKMDLMVFEVVLHINNFVILSFFMSRVIAQY